MKKIIGYFRDYFRTELNWGLYLTLILFLGTCLVYNYSTGFDWKVMDSYRKQNIQILFYFLFYALPYFFTLFAYVLFTGRNDFLHKKGFWFTLIFGLLLLSINSWFWQYAELIRQEATGPIKYFLIKCFYNLKRFAIFIPALYIFWKLWNREVESFYGLTRKNFHFKPYFIMLLIVLPGIFAVSFLPDFQQAYPSYTVGRAEGYWGVSAWATVPVYELAYGLDFATAELFFRGFLVLGMVKWLGKGAILPMVSVYCFLHFGKPMGEAISSIFGGFILGVIAYYSRSILGGIILHIGLAWMMDLFAALQNFVLR